MGDPQCGTMSRIGVFGLCSFGTPFSFGACGTEQSVVTSSIYGVEFVKCQ